MPEQSVVSTTLCLFVWVVGLHLLQNSKIIAMKQFRDSTSENFICFFQIFCLLVCLWAGISFKYLLFVWVVGCHNTQNSQLIEIKRFKDSILIAISNCFFCSSLGVVPIFGRKCAICSLLATWRTQKCSYEYCYQRQIAKYHH